MPRRSTASLAGGMTNIDRRRGRRCDRGGNSPLIRDREPTYLRWDARHQDVVDADFGHPDGQRTDHARTCAGNPASRTSSRCRRARCGTSPRRRRRSCRTPGRRPRAASRGAAPRELARGAAGDELGEHRDRDLGVVDRAEVEPGRRVHPRELRVVDALVAQQLEQSTTRASPPRPRRCSRRRWRARPRARGRRSGPGSRRRSRSTARCRGRRGRARCARARDAGARRRRRRRRSRRRPSRATAPATVSACTAGERPITTSCGRGEERLQVDLHRALALARHRDGDDASSCSRAVELVGRAEEQQPRLAVGQRRQRLPHDGRLARTRRRASPRTVPSAEHDALRPTCPELGARRHTTVASANGARALA